MKGNIFARKILVRNLLDLLWRVLRLHSLLFEFRWDEFEVFYSPLIALDEEIHLRELGAQVVCLPDGLEDFQDVVELLIRLEVPSVEGDIALGTTRKHIHGFLVWDLHSDAVMAEKVKAWKLNRIHVDLEANRALHLIPELLVSFLWQCVCSVMRRERISVTVFLLYHGRHRNSLSNIRVFTLPFLCWA